MKTVALFLCLTAGAVCQSPRVEFEAATIKPIAINSDRSITPDATGFFSIGESSVNLRGMALRTIIARAFQVPPTQVLGLEGSKYDFDVTAKIAVGYKREQVPAMLQALLQDRFGMWSHEEKRSVSGFQLHIENSAVLRRHLLREETGGLQPPGGISRAVRMEVPLSSLVWPLSDLLRAPLAADFPDTGEKYVFWLETAGGADSVADSLKQYGLRLTRDSVDVRYIVVDKINQLPAEN